MNIIKILLFYKYTNLHVLFVYIYLLYSYKVKYTLTHVRSFVCFLNYIQSYMLNFKSP